MAIRFCAVRKIRKNCAGLIFSYKNLFGHNITVEENPLAYAMGFKIMWQRENEKISNKRNERKYATCEGHIF